MAKKKKRSSEQMLRQVQDSLQALPYAVQDHRENGRWFKAFLLRYVSSPMLRVMSRALGSRRYRGVEGQKLKQTDQMKRHLQQKQAARKHIQEMMRGNDPAEVARQVSLMKKKATGGDKKAGARKAKKKTAE
jgi:hypothetical protein